MGGAAQSGAVTYRYLESRQGLRDGPLSTSNGVPSAIIYDPQIMNRRVNRQRQRCYRTPCLKLSKEDTRIEQRNSETIFEVCYMTVDIRQHLFSSISTM